MLDVGDVSACGVESTRENVERLHKPRGRVIAPRFAHLASLVPPEAAQHLAHARVTEGPPGARRRLDAYDRAHGREPRYSGA